MLSQAFAQITFFENAAFQGRSFTTQTPHNNVAQSDFNDRASSVVGRNARVEDDRYAPPPQVTHDYGRRRNERLYQAPITSVRAVVGVPTQRCWIEREQVAQEGRGSANVGGAVLGAVIGGILGHQVGGGTGKDVATAIGVIGGAAEGAKTGRHGSGPQVATRDVQRCTSVPGTASRAADAALPPAGR